MRDPSALNATASTDPFILRLSTHCFVCEDETNRKLINIYVSPGLKCHGSALTLIFFKTTKLQSNVKNYTLLTKNVKRWLDIYTFFLFLRVFDRNEVLVHKDA